jgi:RNA recognition motif-containing protein
LSVRLFVGNLSYDATEGELRELFSQAGTVTQVRVPLDRETGRPRGFAFIDLEEPEHAQEAIRQFDQQSFKGRALAVSVAEPREPGSRGPSRGPSRSGPPPSRTGDGPPPPNKATRSFGADAAPRAKRKTQRWATKGPRGPIKEVGGAGFSAGGYDYEDFDDSADDEKPFWEVADTTDSEEQDSEEKDSEEQAP